MRSQRHSIVSIIMIKAALLWGVPAAAGAVTELRDIRGAIFTQGIPPFVPTATALIIGGFLVFRFCRRKRLSDVSEHVLLSQPYHPDSLSRLNNDYRHGSLSSEVIFSRLVILINNHLTACNGSTRTNLTTPEILQYIADANLLTPQNTLNVECLLQLCDLVKFAGHQPPDAKTVWALDIAAGILSSDIGGTR